MRLSGYVFRGGCHDIFSDDTARIWIQRRLVWFVFWWDWQDYILDETARIFFQRRLWWFDFKRDWDELISEEAAMICILMIPAGFDYSGRYIDAYVKIYWIKSFTWNIILKEFVWNFSSVCTREISDRLDALTGFSPSSEGKKPLELNPLTPVRCVMWRPSRNMSRWWTGPYSEHPAYQCYNRNYYVYMIVFLLELLWFSNYVYLICY